MSTQQNEAVVRRVYEQSLNKRNFELLPELISGEYPGLQGAKGPEGFGKPIAGLVQAFPDIQWNIEDLFGEGNEVVVRWQWRGTHKGVFNGYAPTGKTITNDGMAIFVLEDGKITRAQVQTDRLGFLQQIGVVPQDPAQLYARAITQGGIELIDKFFVPVAAKAEFYARMHINRTFIKTLPGFLKDEAYEHTADNGDVICITIAHWASKEAVENAKEAVQAEYKRQGFDMGAMLKKWQITIDRAFYTPIIN